MRDKEDRLFTHATVARAVAAARDATTRALAGIRRQPWLVASLLAYGVLLMIFRPASPFEWDEVLFQRSLDDYNIIKHAPHPPGYPLYVGVAKAVRWLVRDPLLALQLVAVVAALVALAAVYRLAVRLEGAPAAGFAAAALLATMPSFAFHANVGLSDVPGLAAGVIAVAALTAAAERPTRLSWGSACAAAAFGIRPALLPLLVPLGALAVWRVVRARRWRVLALAAVTVIVVTDVIWLPAIRATGPGFWGAWKLQVSYAAEIGRMQRLPDASLAVVMPLWFVRPFGSPTLAAGFWLLVAAGAVMWWRSGHRRLVVVAGLSATAYMLACLFTLEAYIGVRYVLPAVPFFALLAAGVVTGRRAIGRRLAIALIAVWCAAAVLWVAPVYALRRHPAPVWASLSWVRDHFDPSRTTVVYDGVLEPHAYYLLGRAGFTLVQAAPTTSYGGWLRPDGTVLYACPRPVPGGEVLVQSQWDSEKLGGLTRYRYDRCAVTRAPAPGQPVFSPEWRVREADWELWGTGSICLAEDAAPHAVRLQAGDGQLRLRRAGAAAVTVTSAAPVDVTVMPGEAGCLLVNGPGGVHTHLPPAQVGPLHPDDRRDEVASEFVIPLLAGVTDAGGIQWRSDVTVTNLGSGPLPLVAQFLPADRDNSAAPAIEFTLPAGTTYRATDAVGATGFGRWGGFGALLIYADESLCPGGGAGCSFAVFSRTYTTSARRSGPFLGEGMPALAARRGRYGGGRAAFEHVSNDATYRSYVSIATWVPVPVHALVTLVDGAKNVVGKRELDIPPFGQELVPFPGAVTDGRLLVELVKQPETALFYPAVTMVATVTGEPTHLLATPSKKEAPPEWLAARPRRLPVAGGPQQLRQPPAARTERPQGRR